jgi:hypothetical protein
MEQPITYPTIDDSRLINGNEYVVCDSEMAYEDGHEFFHVLQKHYGRTINLVLVDDDQLENELNQGGSHK